MHKKLKIALVDDDSNILTQYGKFIEEVEEMEVVAAMYSVESFLKHIDNFSDLDILLLDIELPGMSGIEAIRKIKKKLPRVNIIMLTTFNDSETIFKALRAGAMGYLIKNLSKRKFQDLLLTIQEGGAPLSPKVAKLIVDHFSPPKSLLSLRISKAKNISDTEKEYLHHLVRGLSYQEVADLMNVSVNTVRYHVKNIYKKLQVNSRSKLIDKYKDFFSS